MKQFVMIFILPFMLMLTSMSSCHKEEDIEDEPQTARLHVEFTNDLASEFSINIMQLRPHGNAGMANSPAIGNWTTNILTEGTVIAPGTTYNMDLDIPNLFWDEYRLGVIDANGNSIMLHEQEAWPNQTGPPITHWGSDKRRCYVTLHYQEENDLILISAWGDNAY